METAGVSRVLWILTGGIALILLIFSGLAIAYPADLRGIDSNVVHTVQQLLVDNARLYLDPAQAPFSITQYSPLFYVLLDAVATGLGVGRAEPHTLLLLCRSVAALLLGLSLWQLYAGLREIGLSGQFACLLLILFTGYTFPWFLMARSDVGVLLMAVLLLRIFLRDRLSLVQAATLGAITALGLGFKLSFGIFAVLLPAYFFIKRKPRAGLAFIAGGLAGGGSVLLTLLVCGYNLSFIKQNMLDGIDNGMDLRNALAVAYFEFIIYVLPLFAIGYLLLVRGRARFLSTSVEEKLRVLLLGTAGFALMTALKVGSAANYFNEFLLVLVFWLGTHLAASHYSRRLLTGLVLLVLLTQRVAGHAKQYLPTLVEGVTRSTSPLWEDRARTVEYLSTRLGNDLLYTNDKMVGLAFPDQVLLFQFDIHVYSFRRGTVDYTQWNDMVKNNQVTYLVLDASAEPRFGLDVDSTYLKLVEFGHLSVYQRKSP